MERKWVQLKYMICGVLLLLTTVASAQETKTWTGTVSSNWSEASNWLPAGQPHALSPVIIKKPANGILPILTENSSARSLVIELGASLTINGQTLTVEGDFKVGTSGIVSDHLIMTNANDQIIIKGNTTFAARTKLEAGQIVLHGNLVQEAVNTALQPGGTVFVFNGAAPQTVSFQRPGTNNQSFLRNVIVRNPAGVSFLSDVHVTGLLQLENGGKLVQQDSFGTYFHEQLPLTGNGDYQVRKSYIAAPIVMNGDRELGQSGNDLTILARQALTLNGHRLRVGGTFTVKAYGSQKHLIMANPADALEIGGDAIFEGYSTLEAGAIFVRGDVIQKVSSAALQPSGAVFVLEGEEPQTVSFERPGLVNRSFLHDVMVKNAAGVNFASDVYITGRMTLDEGNISQSSAQGTYFTQALPAIVSGNYGITNSYVAGALALESNLTLPNVDNNLTVLARHSLTLNGHTLRVGGNFTVNVFEEYKHLFMTQAADTLEINGNAEFQGQSELAAGAIIVKGDLVQKISGKSLQPSGTHFILAGRSPQTVAFEKPGTGNRSFFKDLTLRNSAGVSFASDIFITGQLKLEAGTALNQTAGFAAHFTSALPKIENGTYAIHNTNIAGALVLAEDLRLTEPSASVTILPKQSLTLNGHTLEIGGNFKVSAFSAEKHLIMNNASDRLVVNGNATFEGLNVLQAGTIVLRGNLTQAISAAAIQPEGTTFVFDGTNVQVVSFERPGTGNRSYLHEVTIKSAASVRAITDVFVTGQINNYGRFEVIDTRSLFLGDAAGINHQGGVLVGNGTVSTPTFSFTNEGIVRPGSLFGIMRITGPYRQMPAGKLTITIGGLQPGTQYSRLVVSGGATLDGDLELELINGFTPSVGDSFRVMEFGAADGQFRQIISKLPKNVEFQVRYKASGVDVVTVAAANRAPVAQNDSAATRMNHPVTIVVLQNDLDDNEDALQVTALDLTNTIGTAEMAGDSSVTYIPQENFYGEDSFGYTVDDGRGGISSARVYVTIARTNRPPVVVNSIPEIAVNENSSANVLFQNLSAVFADPDGDALTLSATAEAGLTVWIAGDSLLGTPQPDFSGQVQVTVTARDDSNAVAATSFTVNVIGANKPPATFSLLQPQDGAIVDPRAVTIFRWQEAQDANGDSLRYSVRIFSANADTTVRNIKTTELYFEGRGFLQGATVYQWVVSVSDAEFSTASADTFTFTTIAVTSVENRQGQTPEVFALEQNYPNPFNPSTTISFALPKASDVSLSIFNSNGQLVKQLISREMPAGRHHVTWDATNEYGERVSSGMYLYVIKAGNPAAGAEQGFTARRKLVLMK